MKAYRNNLPQKNSTRRPVITAARVTRYFAACFIAAVLVIAPSADAQDLGSIAANANENLTVEALEQAIEAIKSREDLDDAARQSIVEQLNDAQSQIQNRQSAETAAVDYAAALNTAPDETDRLQELLNAELAPPPTADDLGIDDSVKLDELNRRLSVELAEQVTLESRVLELDKLIEAEEVRPGEARRRISELRTNQTELAALLQSAPPADEARQFTEARRINAGLRSLAVGAEINELEQELLSQGARLNLLRAQLGIAERSQTQVGYRVELLRSLVNAKRLANADVAQRSATEAELAATDKHPVVRNLTQDNADLVRRLPALIEKIELNDERLDQTKRTARNLEQRLNRSKQRLEVGGMNRAIGLLLVEESRNLPSVSQYRSQVDGVNKELVETGLALMRIQEQRRGLTPEDARLAELYESASADIEDEEELAEIRRELRSLLQDRRESLAQMESTYSGYLQVLGELDVTQRNLLQTSAEYQQFLRGNLLWIPSAPLVFSGNWTNIPAFTKATLSPENWSHVVVQLTGAIASAPGNAFFALLLLVAVLLARKPLTRLHLDMNQRVGRLSTDSIGLTIGSLGIAAVRAAPIPLLLGLAGMFLERGSAPTAFSTSIALSLQVVAPFLYNVLWLRVLSARGGTLGVHFRWQEEGLIVLSKQLDRIAAVGAPLIFAAAFFYTSADPDERATLGRVMFVAFMVVIAFSLRPLAHPETGLAASFYKRRPGSLFAKLRWFSYGLALGVPLLLCLLSLLGYVYTSVILTSLLVDTIWLGLALVIVNLIVLRWLVLAHRKLSLRLLLEEREAQRASRDGEDEEEHDGEPPSTESTPLDLDEVDQQTRKLLRAALFLMAVFIGWGIWSEVLPAFHLLEQVGLWTQVVLIDGVETKVPVTLADLVLAALIGAGTIVIFRNLPGLLEITVLQRMTLQAGSRYAINTLGRYAIVTVGVISVLNVIGWNWSQIQWLVAALSVGLGFGLQEIVANFISGLIILFERPIRVGDTVTVGQLTGSVSKVRIRATTITDWDRKEIVVPNKAFITEQVVNWTLADPITRVVIQVGIAYGSDVDKAQRVMESTMKDLPLVLEDPAPNVYFLGFGDSSLDFNLHLYSRQLSDRLPLMHAVHNAVLKALRENDIEIPFPQRDLHLRTTVDQKKDD